MPPGQAFEELPPAARRRLDALRAQPGERSTSFLSATGHALMRRAGLCPLAQVTGSAILQLQNLELMRVMGSREMPALTRALAGGRGSALARLTEEARAVRADAVVGVELTQVERPWAPRVLEFRATGSAVHLALPPRAGRPVLSNLTASELWTLHQAGARPLGLVTGTCASFASAAGVGWQRTTRESLELRRLSDGVTRSAGIARRRLRDAAEKLGAEGVVGVQLAREAHEMGHSVAYLTHLLGTAITGLQRSPDPDPVRTVLDLGA